MKVYLRQRKKGSGKISLYLDYYAQGKRKYEYLKLYLKDKAKTVEERQSNKETLRLAESIRAKRQLEIQNGTYGFTNHFKRNSSFIEYLTLLAEKRKESQGNYGNWDSTLKHLITYCNGQDITFVDVDSKWLEDFRDYLQYKAKTKSGKSLAQNSSHSYFNKVKACLKQALKDKIISYNPALEVDGIQAGEPEREFLTMEELQALNNAECEIPILKTAFIFSCLTGIRWSDINKLVWSEVRYSNELGHFIQFKQQKTKGVETLPISEQARELLGEAQDHEDRVFVGLKYSAWHNLRLKQWVMNAGINKDITFHCARHTYATLQLTMGTDIYTVSKLLGHKELKTTQVYAKIIDQKKVEAAGRIKLV